MRDLGLRILCTDPVLKYCVNLYFYYKSKIFFLCAIWWLSRIRIHIPPIWIQTRLLNPSGSGPQNIISLSLFYWSFPFKHTGTCNCNTVVKCNVHRADPWKDASRCLGGGGGKLRGSGQNLIAALALQRNSIRVLLFRTMDEGRKGYYMEEGGPTYAARSLPRYISAFATRNRVHTSVWREREPELEFLNFWGPQASIPRNWFLKTCRLSP